jgi:hypothetical protein
VYSVSTHSASWNLHVKNMYTVFQRIVRSQICMWKACVQCFNAQCVLKITREKHVYSVSTHSTSWKLHVKSLCTVFQRIIPREKHVYSVSTHSASWKLHVKSMCTAFQRTVRREIYTWKACVQCFSGYWHTPYILPRKMLQVIRQSSPYNRRRRPSGGVDV